MIMYNDSQSEADTENNFGQSDMEIVIHET